MVLNLNYTTGNIGGKLFNIISQIVLIIVF